MGNDRFYEMKYFHTLGKLEEYEWLKVTALNLFHPTASPSLKSPFFHIMTQPLTGEGGVGVDIILEKRGFGEQIYLNQEPRILQKGGLVNE